MCWEDETECYNDGQAFKLTCRTDAGVIVTLIADNYFGYCKKEVKTQISYATNLYGNAEEEHAGGAIVFPTYNLGEEFHADARFGNGRTLDDVVHDYPQFVDAKPEGYAVDRRFPDLIYIAGNASADIHLQKIYWEKDGVKHDLPLLPSKVYMTPSGYKVRMEQHPGSPSWRLIGMAAEGAFCHKPCTVSGGGKSEISKSLVDYMHFGPIFVADPEKDFKMLDEIFEKDYSIRYRPDATEKPQYKGRPSRKILDRDRTLGSVIKLLTPSPQYTDEFNAWLQSIPSYIYAMVFIIKRFQAGMGRPLARTFQPRHRERLAGQRVEVSRPQTGGHLSAELGLRRSAHGGRQGAAGLRRRGKNTDRGRYLHFGGRHRRRFAPRRRRARSFVALPKLAPLQIIENCEFRLFQLPDEAIHRGMDKQTETDLARPDNSISNFEPLTSEQAASA